MFFCFKQHLIFGVIMIIILISFLKNNVIYTKLLFHCSLIILIPFLNKILPTWVFALLSCHNLHEDGGYLIIFL